MAENMTVEQAIEYGKTLSFEKVWAALMEDRAQSAKRSAEFDQRLDKLAEQAEQAEQAAERSAERSAKRSAEFDERMDKFAEESAKRSEKIDKQLEKTDRQLEKNAKELEDLKKTVERVTGNVGGLNRSMGELIETLIAARLWEKFEKYNLKRAYQRVPIYDEKHRILTDIDVLLSNTNLGMAVEIKRELDRKEYVDEHLKRMEIVQKYPPAELAGKKILGAMAGGVVDSDVQRYAYESGFFVLELTGESVELVPPPDGFEPKKW
ncbi:MAG: hypothetical protein LBF83_04995 [Spirochaetaceae bacterium]|jgi:DNA repair exonuclease SbcCD ATPase subunit|nr:hypothetical protein [Spirochaetaceae bacterium]